MTSRNMILRAGIVFVVVAALLSVAVPAEAATVEWDQEFGYSDVAVSADGELRYVPAGSALWVLDREGVMVDAIPGSARSGVDIDGDRFVVAEFRTLSVLDGSGNIMASVELSDAVISDVAISESTVIVAYIASPTGVGEARVEMFSLETLAPLGELLPRDQNRIAAGFGTHGDTLLVGSVTTDGTEPIDWRSGPREVFVFEHLELTDTVVLTDSEALFFPFPSNIAPGPNGTFFVGGSLEDLSSISVYAEDGRFVRHVWTAHADNYLTGFDSDGCLGLVGVVAHDFTDSMDRFDGPYVGFRHVPGDRDPGCFIDTLDSQFTAAISWLGSEGVTKGCNLPFGDRFCPDDHVTRGQMAAFLTRALDYTDDGGSGIFADTSGHLFETAIDKLATEGVTKGCNPPANSNFCPDDFVTRGQMAAFLVRAVGYTDDGGGDLFTDDDGHVFEAAIDKLGTAGVTKGCNPPVNDKFCPDDLVTRAQMAAFLKRALG